jgi:2-polyprenyl-3-methyl-5-hydroxy-6-metoxy-1,4-benzoquinol methylase
VTDQKLASYTSPRADVTALVPATAKAVLDLGCSNGALGASLARAVPGRRVVGIEYDAAFAAEAASRLDRAIQGDLNSFDWAAAFGAERFDCMIFADVLEHLSNPEATLATARDYLTPGGCIIVSLPNIRHVSAFFSIYLAGSFPRRERGIFDRTHLRWFCIADGKRMVTQSGFHIDTMVVNMRLNDRPGGLVNRILRKIPPPVARTAPISDFLGYQFLLRATKSDA